MVGLICYIDESAVQKIVITRKECFDPVERVMGDVPGFLE